MVVTVVCPDGKENSLTVLAPAVSQNARYSSTVYGLGRATAFLIITFVNNAPTPTANKMLNPVFLVRLKSNKTTESAKKKIPPSPKKDTNLKKGVKNPPADVAKPLKALNIAPSNEWKVTFSHSAIILNYSAKNDHSSNLKPILSLW